MPFVVKSGARNIGKVKKRTDKREINRILAGEFRKTNRISILMIASPKVKRKRRK